MEIGVYGVKFYYIYIEVPTLQQTIHHASLKSQKGGGCVITPS